MTTYTPGSISAILQVADLDDHAIKAFTDHHSRMRLPAFQLGLRKFASSQPEYLLPQALLDHSDWDIFATDTISELARWFHTVDPGGRTFDWDSLFTVDLFAFFVAPAPTTTPVSQTTMVSTSLPSVSLPGSGGVSIPSPPTAAAATPSPSYTHSYHNDILLADTKAFHRRAGTAATDVLAAHPLWSSSAISGAIILDKKSFLSTELPTLASHTPAAIHDWYRKLCQQATSTQIDLCPLRQFQKGHALWPQNLPAPIVFEMSSLLLLKLQHRSALDLTNEVLNLLYLEHITHSDSLLAGYYFLHALLSHAADTAVSFLASLPHYADSMDPVRFAASILAYRQAEFTKAREYSPRELSLHFLRELDQHSLPIQVQLKAVEDLATDADVPKSLQVTQLALFLAQIPSLGLPPVPLVHQLLCQPPPNAMPSSCSLDASTPASVATPGAAHPFHQREETQCAACGTWGHSAPHCSHLARTCLLQRSIASHPAHADRAAAKWKDLHSHSHRMAVACHLQFLHASC